MLNKMQNKFENLSRIEFRVGFVAIAIFFVFYKSIYQSSRQLDDIFSLVLLVVLLGLAYRYNDRWNEWVGAFLILLFFLPPLYWLWRTGQYDQSVIAGIFPIGDAEPYYSDALRLHYGFPLSAFSSRRPLFTGFLSVVLKFTGQNLQSALIVLAVMVTLSVILLASELKKSFGAMTAMAAIVLLYYCYKGFGFIGITRTEQLGLPLGVLALTLFLQGIRLHKNGDILFGMLVLTLALNARAGTFFIIPAIILWGAFYNQDKRFSIVRFGALSGMAILGFLLNFLLYKVIGNSQGLLFENFGSTFYGLATGYRGWVSLYIDHPGVQEATAWPYIIEALRQNPWNLLLGIFRAYADYLKPQTMFEFLYFSPESQIIASYFLYVCVFFGFLRLIRMHASGLKYFLLFALGGVFLSIPFTPPTDQGIRAMTATLPFFVLLPALSLCSLSTQNTEGAGNGLHPSFVPVYALFLITLGVLGPIAIKISAEPPTKIPPIVCPQGTVPLGLWVRPGSYVSLIENKAQSYSLVPNLRVKDLRSSTEKNELDYFSEGSAILRRVQPNQTILVGLNLYKLPQNPNEKLIWAIVPTKNAIAGQMYRFCARLVVITHRFGQDEIFLEQTIKLEH